MKTFTVCDLRRHTGELVREAEAGRLFVVAKHGRPVFVAVPFDEYLAKDGINVALAVRLFDDELLSLTKAACIAGMDVPTFMEQLARMNIPVARPREGELARELAAFGD